MPPPGRPLALLALAATTVELASSALPASWHVDPLSIKVMSDRRAPLPSSTKTIDIASQRGECERVQLWGHNDGAELSNVRVLFTSLAASNRDDDAASTLPASAWSYKQQMYVHCNFTGLYQCNEDLVTGTWNSTTMGDAPWEAGHFVNYKYQRWPNCNPGWYPDPLMDVSPGVGIPRIPKGATQPIFLEVCVPTTQAAGNYSGSFAVHAGSAPAPLFEVPVRVEVWDITMPSLNDTR